MKMMMKTVRMVAVTAGLLFTYSFVNAQDAMTTSDTGIKFRFGIGASGSILDGNSPYSYGLGADAKAELWLNKSVAVTASGGYTRLVARDNSPVPAYGYIPAVGGVKVFPIKGMFLQGFAGAGFAVRDIHETAFLFGGGTGYEWDNGLEIGVRYEGNQHNDSGIPSTQSIISQYALRLGFNF